MIPPSTGSANATLESHVDLDFDRFASNIRSAKRGSAPGPIGNDRGAPPPNSRSGVDLTALFRVAVLLSRGQVPPFAVEAVRLGRITALAKPDGGVRGIVVGDVLRRLVAKTIAQQIGDQVEAVSARSENQRGASESHPPHTFRDGRGHHDFVRGWSGSFPQRHVRS